jgi:hypothetical protein
MKPSKAPIILSNRSIVDHSSSDSESGSMNTLNVHNLLTNFLKLVETVLVERVHE